MRLLTIPADANPSFAKLNLSLASTPEEVREVQRLRYKVFIEAMNLSALANPEGLDKDEFDDYCDHLIVRDSKTLSVVGTYRVLSPHGARRMGKFYSEQEFDLSRLPIPHKLFIHGDWVESSTAEQKRSLASAVNAQVICRGSPGLMQSQRASN